MLDLNKNELEILNYWKEKGILAKLKARNSGNKSFYFLDGPPFVSGDLHPGQIWVKTIKDIFLRYKRYRGFEVRDRAGFDVHGLPIENKIEKNLGITSKHEIESKIGIENFIRYCREFVESCKGRMDADYVRFGMSLDFSDPYLPYTNSYIETGWSLLKKAEEKGYLYNGKRTMLYCGHCETPLSQGSLEVEYADETDPAVIVAFKVNPKNLDAKIKLDEDAYLLIWTTTPWTLPANVAIAANPKELYVMVKAEGKNYILAKARLDAVAGNIEKNFIVVKEFYGSELQDLTYISPLAEKIPEQKKLEKYHKVVLSQELVSMNEGTGLVHIAPGHGIEDYLLGKKNKLPIFSPVGMDAKYSDEAGEYKGIKVPFDANNAILKDLQELGVILDKGSIRHSYPHCWRCKSKAIYIATDQWFLKVEKMKTKLINENLKVKWHPREAQSQQESVLKNSPDWCISRQRYWGIPLPIWICSGCNERTVIGSLQELAESSTNKLYVESLNDLHRPHIDNVVLKCSKCSGEMKRIKDIADVWFDSSIAFRASLSEQDFERLFPIDFICEGIDQLRGWFSYMLKSSVMFYGKKPYKNVFTHVMMLAEDGREMHKSLGNYVSLSDVLKTASADTYRLWCASHTPWLDFIFNKEKLRDEEKSMLLLYNLANLLTEYQEAINYKPKVRKRINTRKIDSEEAWIISKFESLVKQITQDLDSYAPYSAANAIKRFIVEDFSRFYLKLAKKKILYGTRKQAREAIDVINYIFFKTCIIISPITPFSTEKIYQDIYKNKESIFMEDWPKPNLKAVNKVLEDEFEIVKDAVTALLSSREQAKVRLRWPLENAFIEVESDFAQLALQRHAGTVENYTNIKKIDVKLVSRLKEEIKPIFTKLGPDFKQNAQMVAQELSKANPQAVRESIDKIQHYTLHTDKGPFTIKAEHFAYVKKAESADSMAFRHGTAKVSPQVSQELKEEALLREFERRIQLIRKELQLKKVNKIGLGYQAIGELEAVIRRSVQALKKSLNATSISSEIDKNALVKEIEIEGEKATVSITKR